MAQRKPMLDLFRPVMGGLKATEPLSLVHGLRCGSERLRGKRPTIA